MWSVPCDFQSATRAWQVGEWELHFCYLEGLLLEAEAEADCLQELAASAFKMVSADKQVGNLPHLNLLLSISCMWGGRASFT